MKALLLDPDDRKATFVEFEGGEESVRELLGHDRLDVATHVVNRWLGMRIFRDAAAIEDDSRPGYIIERTGGGINHGRTLVLGVDENGQLIDVPKVTVSRVYVPGRGAFPTWRDADAARRPFNVARRFLIRMFDR